MANWSGFDTGGGSTTASNSTNKKTTDYHTSGFHTTSGSWGDTNSSYTPTYSDYVESYTPTTTYTDTYSYTPSYSTSYSSGSSSGSSDSSSSSSSSSTDSDAAALALANKAYAEAQAKAKAEQQALIDEYNAKVEAARQNAITTANNALDEQGKAAEQKYNDQLVTIGNDYEDLRRQSEVNRYKAMINQRESLANQGRLEGGAGRQEYLTLNNNYANNLNKINLQEAAERTAIANAINEMWANIGTQKAQNEAATLDTYADSLNQQLQLENLYNYNPTTSDYYNAALAMLGTSNYTTPELISSDSSSNAAKALTLEDLMEYMGLSV